MGNKKIQHYDNSYPNFAKTVAMRININKSSDLTQEEQVNRVSMLEERFKNGLKKAAPEKLAEVYLKFINYIKKDVGNILSSQGFFRVKKTSFKKISSCIKNDEPKKLIEFPINYNLINFIRENWGGPLPEKSEKTYQQFVKSRNILIENNIPLAMNRAKLFHRKTKENNLSLMDLINICIIGLAVGIDKFTGQYTKSWCDVLIGRMTGFLIKEYSTTFIKLFPSDGKILYRANMIKYRQKIEDIEELTAEINASFLEDKRKGMGVPKLPISVDTIQSLLNSSHYLSADSPSPHMINDPLDESSIPDGTYDKYNYGYENEVLIEEDIEIRDSQKQLRLAMKDLSLIEQKIIQLKGCFVW